jgi:hypothetical protein
MRFGTVASVVLAIPLLVAGVAVAGDCVTLVADLGGAVAVADSPHAKAKDRWPAQLLQCLPARKVLTLDSGARTTLFFPAGIRSFDLAGPGRYEVVPDGVRALNGSAPVVQRVLNQAFQDVRLDRAMLTPAGVRMRSAAGERLVLLEPRGIVTEPAQLSFRWRAPRADSGPYRFRLSSENGEVIYEAIADGEQLMLPKALTLARGERLQWRVEETSSPQHGAPRWESFVIATEQVQALARQLDSQTSTPSAAEANLRDLLLMQGMFETH